MATVTLRGIPVSFPFEPYEIQKRYMEKVIECLQSEVNGVLESPTGTGKTLSLLCSSIAWLMVKKAQCQASQVDFKESWSAEPAVDPIKPQLTWDLPKIIYASRTHSQLTQAMQELKRTSYRHVKSSVIGSRDQMCIHPEVSKQEHYSNKILMCQSLTKTRSCHLQNRVEKLMTDPAVTEMNIMDIEDLVKIGRRQTFCPYYMSKELLKSADILFMPYNYLLDPRLRRLQKLELGNSVVILDEAHNIERICEDSTSYQLKATDLTLCIDEVTEVMKNIEKAMDFDGGNDFNEEELIQLKQIVMKFETVLDEIHLAKPSEGQTFEGTHIYTILESAGIGDANAPTIIALLDRIVQFLTVTRDSPFQRTGKGLSILQDILMFVFMTKTTEFREKIKKAFKVHIIEEDTNAKKGQASTWMSKATSKKIKVLNLWCFSPGFGMKMLFDEGIRSLILTSGTLAPLKPLISELGIQVDVRLENPHVVTKDQICVKIVSKGCDGEFLNASYMNRDNPKYLSSLGNSILNISRLVPHGMLIFFPSYPLMDKCRAFWQANKTWGLLSERKAIYVEPRNKQAFTEVMKDFYDRVKDSSNKGAIFMAVCRGKVSEGLDFADINGRAVIVIGLPYPPLKDPRIILKQRYLDLCHSRDKEYLTGRDWYCLEASRAVNQAIGRVIRHRYDYGAIFLLDSRFEGGTIRNQMSMWLRDHIKLVKNFGEIIRDIKSFYTHASAAYPVQDARLSVKEINTENGACGSQDDASLVKIHKRDDQSVEHKNKKFKYNLMKVNFEKEELNEECIAQTKDYIKTLKVQLNADSYKSFVKGLTVYKTTADFEEFIHILDEIFLPVPHLRYLVQGLQPYIRSSHKSQFESYWNKMR